MRFVLEIKCDNAAFCEDEGPGSWEARGREVARILRQTAIEAEEGSEGITLLDYNGNLVGQARFED